jgi:hypothetical protein
MWAFIELLSEQDELLDCISVASSPSIGAIEDTSNPPRRPSICLLGMVRQDVVWWLLSSAVFVLAHPRPQPYPKCPQRISVW